MNAKHPEAFEEVLHKDNQNKATVLGKNLDSMEGEGDAVRNEDNTYRNEEETEMDIHSTNESGDEGAIKDEKDLIDSQNRHPKSPDNLLEDDEEAVSNESEIKESHDVRNDNITYDNDKQEFTRTSVKRSSVHDHFDKVNVQHPKTKKTRGGVICKYCRRQFAHRISSNLKSHLQHKQPEAFYEVYQKDKEICAFTVDNKEGNGANEYESDEDYNNLGVDYFSSY